MELLWSLVLGAGSFAPLRLLWLALGLLSAGAPASGAENGPFVCQTWRAEQGLPQESVWAIQQTRDGYLWIGTGGGLARFDGVRFEVFGIRDGLPSMQIRALLEDRQGDLWIGTANGLCRYRQGKFVSWDPQQGLAGEGITHLAEDGQGAVWIASELGLSRWQAGQLNQLGAAEGLTDADVRALVPDAAGQIWVSLVNQGLLRFDGRQFRPAVSDPQCKSARPYRLLCDQAGQMWAAAVGRIYCLGPTNHAVYGADTGLPDVLITCLAQTADGRLLAGTSDQGLWYWAGGRFHPVRRADGLSDDAVRAIAQDAEGNLWVGTRGAGLNRLQRRQLSLRTVYDGATEAQPLALAETVDGSFWVGTIGHGLYQFAPDHSAVWLRDSLVNRNLPISALLAARDGSLWGVGGTNLFHWQGGSIAAVARVAGVRCLSEDWDGGLWLGDEQGGLQKWVDGRLESVTNPLGGSAITALVPAPEGGLWIATYSHGLGWLKAGHFRVYGRAEGLRSDLLRTLCLDAENTLWIGTEGGGLSQLREGQIANFGRAQGVPEDTILQILADGDDQLWLGTQHGIVRVRRALLARVAAGQLPRVYPRVFGRSDGMLTEQCSGEPGACCQLRHGQVAFATGRGVVTIDPALAAERRLPPAVLLERVVVDGQAFSLGAAEPTAPGFNFPVAPGNQRVEFYFTGLFYTAPERVEFRYQLEGLDGDWNDAGAQRSAVYTHLPPGNYRFVVAAHNGNGVWGPAVAALPITVPPFFWQRKLFVALVAGLLAGLIAWVVRAVEKRKARARLRQLEMAHAMEEERARIARDIHDDIGAGLTEIGLTSELVEDPELSPAEVRGFAHEISLRSRELVAAMDEIVWAINPRNDNLRSSVAYFSQYADRVFKPAGISCRLDVADSLAEFALGSEQRHNFFLGFKEALNNILKHARATEVRISALPEAGFFVLTVQDNGVGFNATPPQAAQDGLLNMRERLAKSGGQCEIHSVPGRGTTVIFRLPWPAPNHLSKL